jgi:hypothetical protein
MLAGKLGEAVRGINEENAIKAIEEILRRPGARANRMLKYQSNKTIDSTDKKS